MGTETPATQVRAVHGRTAVQETRLRTSDQDRSQAKRDMANVAVVEHLDEDEEHREWEQTGKVNWMKRTNELGSVRGSENKRSWICGRSKQRLNVQWRSWEKSVLMNCATVRRREKWSRHDGVTEEKVTHRAANLWRDSFEKKQIPVYRKVHQDQMRRRLADLSGTIMHTPITEEQLVETPEEGNMAWGTARRLRRAMEELRWMKAAFQVYQENLLNKRCMVQAGHDGSVSSYNSVEPERSELHSSQGTGDQSSAHREEIVPRKGATHVKSPTKQEVRS